MIQPLIFSIYEVPKDEGFAIYVDRDNTKLKLSVEEWYSDQLKKGVSADV